MPAAEKPRTDLNGLRVMVTRPCRQAAGFIETLENAGAKTFELPCIDIVYRNPETLLAPEKEKSQNTDWWIFTSVNAVIGARQCGIISDDHPKPKIAAIGQATRRSLKNHNLPADLVPAENSDSEHFIALFRQEITPRDKITIIRGDSGREVLKENLHLLGVNVSYLQVYQRLLPKLTASHAEELLLQALPCVISITSDLGLTNLLKLIPLKLHPQLLACPLVVNSERCARFAKKSGFHNLITTARPPGDRGQLLALSQLSQAAYLPHQH